MTLSNIFMPLALYLYYLGCTMTIHQSNTLINQRRSTMLNKKILATLMAVSLLLLPQPVQANKWKDAVDTITKQRKILKHWQNQKSEKSSWFCGFSSPLGHRKRHP